MMSVSFVRACVWGGLFAVSLESHRREKASSPSCIADPSQALQAYSLAAACEAAKFRQMVFGHAGEQSIDETYPIQGRSDFGNDLTAKPPATGTRLNYKWEPMTLNSPTDEENAQRTKELETHPHPEFFEENTDRVFIDNPFHLDQVIALQSNMDETMTVSQYLKDKVGKYEHKFLQTRDESDALPNMDARVAAMKAIPLVVSSRMRAPPWRAVASTFEEFFGTKTSTGEIVYSTLVEFYPFGRYSGSDYHKDYYETTVKEMWACPESSKLACKTEEWKSLMKKPIFIHVNAPNAALIPDEPVEFWKDVQKKYGAPSGTRVFAGEELFWTKRTPEAIRDGWLVFDILKSAAELYEQVHSTA
eukprot:TRINITY_DN14385_c0_g1_i4.p1 TRINITY_DN14385_c0_g1~~TRINITY_DN14385_c0_g1_i4.p1  ORF type:complete len:361 (+),score=27.96 TRINITY_DN14385_c0_g1_i4:107-1189(+)